MTARRATLASCDGRECSEVAVGGGLHDPVKRVAHFERLLFHFRRQGFPAVDHQVEIHRMQPDLAGFVFDDGDAARHVCGVLVVVVDHHHADPDIAEAHEIREEKRFSGGGLGLLVEGRHAGEEQVADALALHVGLEIPGIEEVIFDGISRSVHLCIFKSWD